jgi:hypothetical protein
MKTRLGFCRLDRLAAMPWALGLGLALTLATGCKKTPPKSTPPPPPPAPDASVITPPVSPFTFAPDTALFTQDISAENNGTVALMHFESDQDKSHLLLTVVQSGNVLMTTESWTRSDGSTLLTQTGLPPGTVQLWTTNSDSPYYGSINGLELQPMDRQSAVTTLKNGTLHYADGTAVPSTAPNPATMQAINGALQALAQEQTPPDAGTYPDGGPRPDPPGYLPTAPPGEDPQLDASCIGCKAGAIAGELSCAVAAAVGATGCGVYSGVCAALGEITCGIVCGVALASCFFQPGPCCSVQCSDGLCCRAGRHCAGAPHDQFCCVGPSCGSGCCEANDVCYQDSQTGEPLCCTAGQILCPPGGASQTCCLSDQLCNALSGACCGSGQQPCGNSCCPSGTCSGAASNPNSVCCPTSAGPGGPCNGVCCPSNQICVNNVCQTSTLSCTTSKIPCWDGAAGNNVVCCDTASCCGSCCETPFQPSDFVCSQGSCLEVPP